METSREAVLENLPVRKDDCQRPVSGPALTHNAFATKRYETENAPQYLLPSIFWVASRAGQPEASDARGPEACIPLQLPKPARAILARCNQPPAVALRAQRKTRRTPGFFAEYANFNGFFSTFAKISWHPRKVCVDLIYV